MDLYNLDLKIINPSDQMPLHKQDTWEITYIAYGRGRRTLGDSVTEFTTGNLAFIPPHIPHTWDFDPHYTDGEGKVSHYTCTFRTEFFDRCESAFPELTDRMERLKTVSEALSFDDATQNILIDLLKKMHEEKKSEQLPYVFRMLLVLSKSLKNAKKVGKTLESDRTAERLDKIRKFTQDNFSNSITIDMIAEHVGMNRSSFCTFFKKATGQTYITYLNKLRVDRACTLLREGKNDIAKVCTMVGFNDVPYFNRCFKNNRGMSPKEYADGVMTNRQMVRGQGYSTDKK